MKTRVDDPHSAPLGRTAGTAAQAVDRAGSVTVIPATAARPGLVRDAVRRIR